MAGEGRRQCFENLSLSEGETFIAALFPLITRPILGKDQVKALLIGEIRLIGRAILHNSYIFPNNTAIHEEPASSVTLNNLLLFTWLYSICFSFTSHPINCFCHFLYISRTR